LVDPIAGPGLGEILVELLSVAQPSLQAAELLLHRRRFGDERFSSLALPVEGLLGGANLRFRDLSRFRQLDLELLDALADGVRLSSVVLDLSLQVGTNFCGEGGLARDVLVDEARFESSLACPLSSRLRFLPRASGSAPRLVELGFRRDAFRQGSL